MPLLCAAANARTPHNMRWIEQGATTMQKHYFSKRNQNEFGQFNPSPNVVAIWHTFCVEASSRCERTRSLQCDPLQHMRVTFNMECSETTLPTLRPRNPRHAKSLLPRKKKVATRTHLQARLYLLLSRFGRLRRGGFRNSPSSPPQTWCDLGSDSPNQGVVFNIDFSDISLVVDAFRGRPYPFPGPTAPNPCP